MVDPEYQDDDVDYVVAWLNRRIRDPEGFFGDLVRRAVDEVLDGPRTGRWHIDQLEKTEATYVGTKVEILLRTALELEHGGFMDLDIDGRPVDIKWSKTSVWQIPREAVNQVCLCIGGTKKMTLFQVGVVRCRPEYFTPGDKQGDKKRTLSLTGRAAMVRLVTSAEIPPNFVAEMDPDLRTAVMGEPTIQRRVTALFKALPYVPIPRNAIQTIARTPGDPIRRTRADAGRSDPLAGMKVLSATYGKATIEALGRPPLAKDHWMAVPLEDLNG
jgi:Restriction endonuclease NaeI